MIRPMNPFDLSAKADKAMSILGNAAETLADLSCTPIGHVSGAVYPFRVDIVDTENCYESAKSRTRAPISSATSAAPRSPVRSPYPTSIQKTSMLRSRMASCTLSCQKQKSQSTRRRSRLTDPE